MPSHEVRYGTNLIFMVYTREKFYCRSDHPNQSFHQHSNATVATSATAVAIVGAANARGAAHSQHQQKQGNARVHGFYRCSRKYIFDVRITDTSCCSNRNTDPDVVLKHHEKEKKDKYCNICLERRMDFFPLVYLVDGIPGRDTRAAEKHLAKMLSYKWNRPYS